MKSQIVIFFSLLFLFSCDDKIKENYFDKICKGQNTFRFDTSRNSDNYAINANIEYLGLTSLRNPSDTFYLRVEYSTDTVDKIFEYSFYKSKTSYKVYTFPVEFKSGKILFNKKNEDPENFAKIFSSKNRDEKFINELEKNNILELPLMNNVKGYMDNYEIVDGYTIQYSNKCGYGIFIYYDILSKSKQFKEANSIRRFVKYLKEDFDF